MGARLLREWITLPLRSVEGIRLRHGAVQELIGSWEKVQKRIRPICDLERVSAKVGAGRANATRVEAHRREGGDFAAKYRPPATKSARRTFFAATNSG